MNKKTTMKSLTMAAVSLLGVAPVVHAQDATSSGATSTSTNASSQVEARYGVLGERFTALNYDFTHVNNPSSMQWNGGSFDYNQPLSPGLDAGFGYDWARSSAINGSRAQQQDLMASLTTFTDVNGMRPFFTPGVGWTFIRNGTGKTDSLLVLGTVGVEFQLARALVLTPYVEFSDATRLNTRTWDFGVKADYRLTKEWGIGAGIALDQHRDTSFTAGIKYHF